MVHYPNLLLVLLFLFRVTSNSCIYGQTLNSSQRNSDQAFFSNQKKDAINDFAEAQKVIFQSPDSAYKLLQRVLMTAKVNDDLRFVAEASHLISIACFLKGELVESSLAAQEGLNELSKLLPSPKRDSTQARLHMQMGVALEAMGMYDKSYDNYQRSLRLANKLNDTGLIAKINTNLGNTFLYQEKYNEALDYYKADFSYLKNTSRYRELFICHNNIGTAYAFLGEYDSASVHYTQALKYSQEEGYLRGEAMNLDNMGYLYAAREDYEKAIPYYHRSMSLYRQLGDQRGMAQVMTNLSHTLDNLNDHKLALQLLDSALRIAKRISDPKQVLLALNRQRDIYAELGDFKQAYILEEQKDSIQNRLDKMETLEKIERQKAELELEKREIEFKRLQGTLQLEKKSREKDRYIIVTLILGLLLLVYVSIVTIKNQRLRFQHNALESRQQLLLAQMNPHFIFNALNSIQYFILRKSPEMSYRYMEKFSRVIRHVLNTSDQAYADLETELEIIRNYLELEQLRTDYHFEFKIVVDQAIDQALIEIPSMILQTLIENAIWHGIMPKEDAGEILIKACLKPEKVLEIVIQDDGIGRKQASLLQQLNNHAHESRGLKLVEQRISLLNKKRSGPIQLVIEDLVDKNQSAGTRVILIIPLKYH